MWRRSWVAPVAAAAALAVGTTLVVFAVGGLASPESETQRTPVPPGARVTTAPVTAGPGSPEPTAPPAGGDSPTVVATGSPLPSPPPAARPPAAPPAPPQGTASDSTSFTASQVMAAASGFLKDVGAGRAAAYRAACTPSFAAAMQPPLAGAAPGDLASFEILMALRQGGRWVAYVGERWSDGERQSRYVFQETRDGLLVDGVEYADIP